jgi:hypothetical protein
VALENEPFAISRHGEEHTGKVLLEQSQILHLKFLCRDRLEKDSVSDRPRSALAPTLNFECRHSTDPFNHGFRPIPTDRKLIQGENPAPPFTCWVRTRKPVLDRQSVPIREIRGLNCPASNCQRPSRRSGPLRPTFRPSYRRSRLHLIPGMMPGVLVEQAGIFHRCINLRRTDTGVAEHLLDRPQIRPATEQMRGERVPQ